MKLQINIDFNHKKYLRKLREQRGELTRKDRLIVWREKHLGKIMSGFYILSVVGLLMIVLGDLK